MGVYIRGTKWWMDYYVGKKRVRECVGATNLLTKKEVKRVLRGRMADVLKNKWVDLRKDVRMQFEKATELYYEKHSKVNKRSCKRDLGLINNLKVFFKGRCLDEITPEEIEDYRADRKARYMSGHGRQLAPATLNREVACLKAVYNKMINWGHYIGVNPVDRVKLYKENNTRKRFLSEDEIRRLMQHSAPYLRIIILMMILSGMRKTEALNIMYSDIDFNNNIIYIRDSKSGYAKEIPLNLTLKKILLNDKINNNLPESEYVCRGRNGKRIRDIRTVFKTACRRAEIKDINIHDLRRTAGSQLAIKGVDINRIKDILGHRDIKTTLRYAFLCQPDRAKAIENLTDVIVTSMVTNEKDIVGLLEKPL